MKPLERFVLPLVGLGVFLFLWKGVVELTRPAPVRRPTLGFSLVAGGRTTVAVIDERQRVTASEVIELGAAQTDTAVEQLRALIGAQQPSLAALPPEAAGSSALSQVVQAAQHEFGGALESEETPTPMGSPVEEAIGRARTLQERRQVRPSWLPDPGEAFTALAELGRTRWDVLPEVIASLRYPGEILGSLLRFNEILGHSAASLWRIFVGFSIAALVGIPLGLAMGSFPLVSALFNSLVQALRPISPIAWLPVATLVFGGAGMGAIFLVFLAALFPIVVYSAAAVGTLDPKHRRSAANFGVRGLDFARFVLIPATLPMIFTALRVSVGVAWLVVVAAEMLGVEEGLGYLVLDARNQLRYDRVVAAMIVIGLIGLVMDAVFRRFERRVVERRGIGAR